jgi:hypothetical protein
VERDELKSRIQQQLRTLRDATDQKSAVAWMRDAYLLLESALREIDRTPAPAPIISLPGLAPIVATPTTKVYGLPNSVLHRHPHIWLAGETVVYEDVPRVLEKPKPEPKPLGLKAGRLPKHNRMYGRGNS